MVTDVGYYLQVYDNALYYADSKFRFMKCKLDGSDPQVVLDKAVYYPWVIDDEWIIYQDDADSETLHLYSVEKKYDTAITGAASEAPVIDGSTLWYTEPKGKNDDYHLVKADLSKWDNAKKEFASEKGEREVAYAVLPWGDELYLGEFRTNSNCRVAKGSWKELEYEGKDDNEKAIEYVAHVSPDIIMTLQIGTDDHATAIYCRKQGADMWTNVM